jgi:hypothetical protein
VQDPHGTDPDNVVGADRFRDPFLETHQRGIRVAGGKPGQSPPKIEESGGWSGRHPKMSPQESCWRP